MSFRPFLFYCLLFKSLYTETLPSFYSAVSVNGCTNRHCITRSDCIFIERVREVYLWIFCKKTARATGSFCKKSCVYISSNNISRYGLYVLVRLVGRWHWCVVLLLLLLCGYLCVIRRLLVEMKKYHPHSTLGRN